MKTTGIHVRFAWVSTLLFAFVSAWCLADNSFAQGKNSDLFRTNKSHDEEEPAPRRRHQVVEENSNEHDDHEDDKIERNFRPRYLDQAGKDASETRDETQEDEQERSESDTVESQWPVNVRSIGNTNASYQNYGGDPYFHHGIDIRADGGSDVVSCAGGTVINIQKYGPSDLYWEVAIQDDKGYIWQYHHVAKESITREMYDAWKSRTYVPAGTKIGTVVVWPNSDMGERYDHVHINVIGSGGIYLNPLNFLPPLEDNQAPWVNRISLMQNGRSIGGQTVQAGSQYSLSADVADYVHSNLHLVPPNRISYSIDGGDERTVWSFESLPGGASKTDYINDFYVQGETTGGATAKRFIVNLGFNGGLFPQERGQHSMRIWVSDQQGNETEDHFDWHVQ